MKQVIRKFTYFVVFVLCFFIFFLLTFPFGLVKEAVEQEVSLSISRPVTIDRISLGLPLGLNIRGLKIGGGDRASNLSALDIQNLEIDISLWRLLLGDLRLIVFIDNKEDGEMEIMSTLPIIQLVRGNFMPKNVRIQSQNFLFTPFIYHALNFYIASSYANPLVTPLLEQIYFKGRLQGNLYLNFPTSSFASVDGELKMQLLNFSFESQDPNVLIPEQIFSQANFQAKIESGAIVIDPSSQFVSPQLAWEVKGTVQLKSQLISSTLDLETSLKMSGDVLEQLGVIMQMALLRQEEWDGNMRLRLQGSFASPQLENITL